jgi:hypothetical protein
MRNDDQAKIVAMLELKLEVTIVTVTRFHQNVEMTE